MSEIMSKMTVNDPPREIQRLYEILEGLSIDIESLPYQIEIDFREELKELYNSIQDASISFQLACRDRLDPEVSGWVIHVDPASFVEPNTETNNFNNCFRDSALILKYVVKDILGEGGWYTSSVGYDDLCIVIELDYNREDINHICNKLSGVIPKVTRQYANCYTAEDTEVKFTLVLYDDISGEDAFQGEIGRWDYK